MSELLSVDSLHPLSIKILVDLLVCDGFTFQESSYSCAIIDKHKAGDLEQEQAGIQVYPAHVCGSVLGA